MNYTSTPADRIWNRACEGGGASPRPGDVALAGLLVFHGAAMNGGVLHAIECLSTSQLHASILGFNFFGLGEVADLIEQTIRLRSESREINILESALDTRYWKYIPDDTPLMERFKSRLAQNCLDFSPPD